MNKLNKFKSEIISVASLFTSVSTLICCALPLLLVTLGMGAVMAGLTAELPILITISKYKLYTFLVGGTLIGINFWLIYGRMNNEAACEIGEDGKETACHTASRWSKLTLWIATGLYLVGFSASYLYVPITRLFQ